MKLATLALVVCTLALASTQAAPPTPRYRLKVLTGDGIDPSVITGWALNDKGEATGYARFGDFKVNRFGNAFLYQGGKVRALPPLAGITSRGLDINNRGEVAGYFVDPTTRNDTPYLYSKGRLIDLSVPLRPETMGQAVALNNRSQVVGTVAGGGTFLYEKGSARYIPADTSVPYHPPNDINDRGDVVGKVWRDCCTYDAYVLTQGQLQRLPSLGGEFDEANAINNKGVIVGRSWTADMKGYLPVIYHADEVQSLGSLGGLFGTARDINDAGWIVGQTTPASGREVGFVYHDGQMYDLNTLLAGGIGKLHIVRDAVAINQRGQILAYTALNNVHQSGRTVILTPVTESSNDVAMLMAGLGVVGWVARRSKQGTA
jgi:probable HAF family extracellular repeat protein